MKRLWLVASMLCTAAGMAGYLSLPSAMTRA